MVAAGLCFLWVGKGTKIPWIGVPAGLPKKLRSPKGKSYKKHCFRNKNQKRSGYVPCLGRLVPIGHSLALTAPGAPLGPFRTSKVIFVFNGGPVLA